MGRPADPSISGLLWLGLAVYHGEPEGKGKLASLLYRNQRGRGLRIELTIESRTINAIFITAAVAYS